MSAQKISSVTARQFGPVSALVLLVVGLSLSAASGCVKEDDSCSRDSNCFEGEICRQGTCVDEDSVGPEDAAAPTDTGANDTAADESDTETDASDQGGGMDGTEMPDTDDASGDVGDEKDSCSKKTWYLDDDDDSFGTPDQTKTSCTQPSDYVDNQKDCDDSDDSVNPDASELCNNVDDDCDDTVDEGFDKKGTTCSDGTGVCQDEGEWVCESGGNGTECNASANTSNKIEELCLDARDNDCDGETDETDDAVGVGFTRIEMGNAHWCGLNHEGTLYCWGQNWVGQVGDGSTDDVFSPTKVSTNKKFEDFALGGKHTCGITESNTIYCWGPNGKGQMGDGSSDDSPQTTPEKIEMPTDDDGNPVKFTSITAGGGATCALNDSGNVYCWGGSSNGELGQGNDGNLHEAKLMSTSTQFKSISLSQDYACGLANANNSPIDEGTAYCWGRNNKSGVTGVLGTGSTDDNVLTPEKVENSMGDPLVLEKIETRYRHICGLNANNELKCWGHNGKEQIALDSSNDPVTTPNTIALGGVSDETVGFGMGRFLTCAIRSQRTEVYCWGGNNGDALGVSDVPTGETTSTPEPIELENTPIREITGGWPRTCALTTDGQAYCWGDNAGASADILGVGRTDELISTPESVLCP